MPGSQPRLQLFPAPSPIIAANLARLRMERGMSLSEIARQAGLAKGTLSELELGIGNPTIATLYAIASVLQVTVGQLVSNSASPVAVERADGANWTSAPEMMARPISQVFAAGLMETYEVRLTGGRRESAPHPPGTMEHVFVISGRVRVGPSSHPETLGPGDAIRFAGDVPHVYEALRGTPRLHVWLTIPQPRTAAFEVSLSDYGAIS